VRIQDVKGGKWKSKNVKLFDGISGDDVNQAGVGNCWYCALISSIAEHNPDVIENMFNPKEFNPYGIYSLKLNIESKIV